MPGGGCGSRNRMTRLSGIPARHRRIGCAKPDFNVDNVHTVHAHLTVPSHHHRPHIAPTTIMFSRPRLRADRLLPYLRHNATKRTITAAPKPNSGPLMSRRSDRALPTLTTSHRWLRTIPLFAAIMFASTAAIFNYQKQSSSVVSSTLYALRTNALAREILGEEIYFASSVPWIRGEINQLHGRIDVSFWVKGTRGKGRMRFKSRREGRMGYVSFAITGP